MRLVMFSALNALFVSLSRTRSVVCSSCRLRSYSSGQTLYLNRLLFEQTECTSNGDSWVCAIPSSDRRAMHLKEVLKVSAGETIRAGILDRGLCDRAEVESVGSDSGPVTVRMEQRAMLSGDARPKVSLICTLPRPRRFEQMLPVIANLGVQSIVVVGAADVPNDYFGSHLLRRPDLVREGLVTGLAQAATDCRVPSLVFRRSLSSFLSSELDTFFPQEVFHRAVAHPLSAMDNDVFGVEAPSVKLADLAPPLELSVDHIVVAVGGEGGWYQKELAMMRDRGFRPVHLGTRVLRSDVAVGSILTIANDLVERWARARHNIDATTRNT